MRSSESLVNGRIKLVAAGNFPLPGKCAICGSVERAAIDFGLTVDFYGAVLICTDCLLEASQVVDETVAPKAPAASPLSFIDTEAVNEYVRRASDATDRLLVILDAVPSINHPSDEDASEDGASNPGAEPKPERKPNRNPVSANTGIQPFIS